MNSKKAPGEDGTTGEIFKQAFENFPKYVTATYDGCCGKEIFQRVGHALN